VTNSRERHAGQICRAASPFLSCLAFFLWLFLSAIDVVWSSCWSDGKRNSHRAMGWAFIFKTFRYLSTTSRAKFTLATASSRAFTALWDVCFLTCFVTCLSPFARPQHSTVPHFHQIHYNTKPLSSQYQACAAASYRDAPHSTQICYKNFLRCNPQVFQQLESNESHIVTLYRICNNQTQWAGLRCISR